MSEQLVRDVVPAAVTVGSKRYDPVRAFLTTERLIAWAEGPGRVPHVVVEIAYAESNDQTGAPPKPNRGTFGRGEFVEVMGLSASATLSKGSGCACGSPLRALTAPAPW